MAMKTNFHTHTLWCDGSATVAEMCEEAVRRGFDALGFSSHATERRIDEGALTPDGIPAYVAEVRRQAALFAGRLRVFCGLEAEYVRGVAIPDRRRFAEFQLDYLIGSIHYVVAPDGAVVAVDDTPESLQRGIAAHFGGDAEAFVRAYFRQEREMVANFDFDIVGHGDLVRKFNLRAPFFDESASWYLEELAATAEAIAASGKLVEVNTGAIARGWRDDAYPSAGFSELLRARGVRFVLSSDAHAPSGLDAAFDRYASADFVAAPCGLLG